MLYPSYVEVTITNPDKKWAQQGGRILRDCLAANLIATDHYMVYTAASRHETRIAANPCMLITVTADAVSVENIRTGETAKSSSETNIFKQVESLLQRYAPTEATAYGYIAFDLVVPGHQSDLRAPLLSFFVPELEMRITPDHIHIRSLNLQVLQQTLDMLHTSTTQDDDGMSVTPESFPVSEQDADWYMQGVQTITEAIHRDIEIDGPLQKVILSRAVVVSDDGDLDLVSTHQLAEQHNLAARSYCLRMGNDAAVGCSPETMLEADGTGKITSNPLAGTRWRGATQEQDMQLAASLSASHKQRTEHLLSVLEVQRELEAVCAAGSVYVQELAHVQKYRTVQHLASRLSGVLASTSTVWDAVRVLFPGVTVSGIGKAASLEWIQRLEPTPRGLYAGAIGWIGSDGSADLAIALRTIFQRGKVVSFRAGAGIVAASSPRDEYEETWHKMQTMWPYLVRSSDAKKQSDIPDYIQPELVTSALRESGERGQHQ